MIKTMINQTAAPLEIRRKDGSHLTIPALGEVRLKTEEFSEKFAPEAIEQLEKNNSLNVKEREPITPLLIAIGFDFWWIIIGLSVGLIVSSLRDSSWYWWLYFGGLVLIPVIGGLLTRSKKQKRSLAPVLNQYISLLFVLLIGFGLPAATMYFFSQEIVLIQEGEFKFSLILMGRIIQLIIIVIASLLPALLFFLFDRQLMSTLRSEFYQHVLLLDPNFKTIDQVKYRYQKRVEEIYGSEDETGGRLLNDTRWPILVGTFLITIGWILTLPVTGSMTEIKQAVDLHKFLVPNYSPLSYAFLGSYFFGINMVFRRYVRADLRPKAYSHIAVRILITFILVWFFNAVLPATGENSIFDNQQLLISIAFFVGILPETWLVIFREYTKIGGEFLRKIVRKDSGLEEDHPLTNLEGINLYHRARLMEEGIENIENLAHHDLVDLILRTRIPVPVLIDWVDQAILYLHTYTPHQKDQKSPLKILQGYGIRTATDLERAHRLASERNQEKEFMNMLPSNENSVKPVQIILDALTDDEWMRSIKNWRVQHNILSANN